MNSTLIPQSVGRILAIARVVVSPRSNAAAARKALSLFWRNRELSVELTRRDLGSQYEGQALGSFWIIGHPLVLMLVYIFVFVFVFKVRLAPSAEVPRDYTTYILSGLVPWLAIQQSLVRASNALLAQANLVRQVVFPVEILPLVAVLVPLSTQIVGFIVITVYLLVVFGALPWTFVLLPVAIGLQFLMMTGIAFVLAGTTPFLRDLKEIVTVFTVIGVFLIPAFYLPDWVSGYAKLLIYANPFSHVIWVFQDIIYFGAVEHPYAWAVFAVMSVASFAIGFRIFSAVKPYVANVL